MSIESTLKRTPLFEEHIKLKAKMVPFGGWEMPLQYEGILAEYVATREKVSIFDTSHMGEFLIQGDAATCGLDRLVSQPINDMNEKSCRYGVLLNDDGGVLDDLIVYRLSREQWMVVVNGATMQKDAEQFEKWITAEGAFRNISMQTGKLDIQGPGSREILSSLVEDIEKLDYYTFDEFSVLGEKVIVSRTGYTGELGYEIYFPWDKTSILWSELIGRNIQPAGLGVRDVLRIEMGYSLYGHELTEDFNPLEAGLKRFIDWDKDFVGKEALLKLQSEGIQRKIVCLKSDSRRSPRANHRIFTADGEDIGIVTSGTFSPSLKQGIGLGFIDKDRAVKGDLITFGDEKNKIKAQITTRPFYKGSSLKS